MISTSDLKKIKDEMDKVSACLIALEKTDDKADKYFITSMETTINEMYGALYAYSLGYRQEVQ